MDAVDIDEPHRPRHRVAWTMGALAAIVVGIVVAVDVGSGRGEPSPSPSAKVPKGSITADQETYLVYTRWQEGVAFATCMTARGFPREPVVSGEHGRIGRVAGFLGIVPVAPTQWLAPAEARNDGPATPVSRLDDLNAAAGPTAYGGCREPIAILDLADKVATGRAVAAALKDGAFRDYVAEAVWFDDHPEEAQLYSTHTALAATGYTPTPPSPTWEVDLDALLAFIGPTEGWVSGPREGYGEFSQVVGRLGDGSRVIIRVGQPEVIVKGFIANVDWPLIRCGDAAIIMGSATYARPETSAARLYAALAPEVCGALP
jgi:hypothetical protein